jgi:hypothetical protein
MENTDVYNWLQSFFDFRGILPIEESNDFVTLILVAPVHVTETFMNYILETFVSFIQAIHIVLLQ